MGDYKSSFESSNTIENWLSFTIKVQYAGINFLTKTDAFKIF